ncbi:non-ribosomal peptide synthetase [Amycolatopsis sp. PS_44_ISF1]|uniref:non-ribosomal peptide synthetase n=1 Tax=Amycolatopsis sp. PS_44_ISF1 TaxID=2974917 RepID=UPI0028DF6448|nr:non-ribosomal peptide synthetase [Amycolatopsis sp. PS_44_ISF1]MDT8912922.1 amino acid adenylation domain-containing protein [Amycolatopsis sp. PS_44_ISF1]
MTSDGFPLSFAQDQLWFLDQLRSGATEYLLHRALRLRGPLDVAALAAALTELSARHEILRTRYRMVGERSEQLVDEPGPAPLTVVDLSAVPAADQERRVDELVASDLRAPIDLTTGAPWRVMLAHLGPDDAALLIAVHHIAFDGWSWGVLARELSTSYSSFAAGEPSPLPEPELQYADYADWLHEWWDRSPVLRENQLGYWRERLTGLAPLELPADRARPAVWDATGGSVDLTVPPALAADLAKLGADARATPFMVYLAGFQVLLSRYSGQQDVAVGVSVAGRNQVELEDLIGLFVNTIVMRTDLSGTPSFTQLLGRVRDTTLDAYERQDVPFEKVVAELAPERDLSRNPLFQVGFGLHNWDRGAFELPGLAVSELPTNWTSSAFDLSLHLLEHDDGTVTGQLLYPAALFDRSRVERLAHHFLELLTGIAATPDAPVETLGLLTKAEHEQLAGWNETVLARPGEQLPALVRAQAAATPDTVAVVADDRELTYAALLSDVDSLTDYLVARGVSVGTPVGVSMARGADLVVALLAVLESGGVYVPLPPDLPAERRAFMVRDAGVTLVLDEVRGKIGTAPPAARPALDGRDAAYILYTSGSTGKPKGVVITHEGICNRVLWSVERYGMTAADRVLQKTSLAFDASVWEFLSPLVSGGAVVMAPEGAHHDPAVMVRAVAEHDVTVLQLVPSVLRLVVSVPELAACTSLRAVCSAGEPLPSDLCAELLAAVPGRIEVVNTYGPTECSIDSTAWTYDPGAGSEIVPIGVPLPNATAYVVDTREQLVPVGIPGELCVGGVGLARGYLGRGDLTAELFTPNPYGTPGERWYRTGDVVRRRADGSLEFVGRVDDQVKIRGVRVELDEVAAAVRSHPAVDASVVVTRRSGPDGLELVAYVVPSVPEDLRAHLQARLHPAMVPVTFTGVEALPLSASGKVDRAALPDPAGAAVAAGFVEPRTPAEATVARILAEVLGIERAGAEDDFFGLGGHSLLAIRLVMRLRREFDVQMGINDLFAERSVARLAAFVAGEPEQVTAIAAMTPADRSGDLPLSFGQERMWFLDQLEPGSVEYLIPLVVRLRGPFDVSAFRRAVETVVARHEVLRTRYTSSGGDPVQLVDPAGPVPFELVEASEADAVALIDEASSHPFDLGAEQPLRVTVARIASDEHLVALTMHHIAFDVWSMGIFLTDLDAAYRAAVAGEDSPLRPLAVHYADFAVWQREQEANGSLVKQLDYWRTQLAGLVPVELPTDQPRPAVRDSQGETLAVDVPAEVAGAVAALGHEHGATPFMVLLAAFQVLLGRYTGRTDVAVGTPVAGRIREETEELLGFFVNNLVLRTDLSARPTFTDLLAQVRTTVLDGFANQDLPFEHLVDALRPDRDLSRHPLFQIMFELQHLERLPATLGDAAMELVGSGPPVAKFDLTLSVEQHADGRLRCWFEYATGLFDRATVEGLAAHYLQVLASIAADPATRVDELEVAPSAERERLLTRWADPAGGRLAALDPAGRHSLTVPQLFEQRVAATPDAVAVVHRTDRLTYTELNEQANRLANHLRSLGVGPEVVVASCLERGPHAVVVLLAVLKAGGAYVPFDPNHPAERLGFMLADAGARLVLTTAEFADRLAGHQVITVDGVFDGSAENPESVVTPDNLAYMIYTSGSTGRPKGVLVEHRSYAHHCHVIADAYDIGTDDRVVLLSALTFDVAMDQIAATLIAGAAIVVAEPLFWTPAELPDRLAEHGVTIMEITPAYYRELLAIGDLGKLRALRLMNVGSDVVTVADARRWAATGLPGRFLCNYGPTEATVTCVLHRVSGPLPGAREEATMPIGSPVPGTRAYIVDEDLRLRPAGVPGELVLGGTRVARGYHDRPALTAERFVPDPFGPPGGRLYRTGDLARHRPDGAIEFLGRIDQQVKVRGYRIELGEIEAALAGHDGIRSVAVVARHTGPGERRLVAYLVPEPGREPEVAALRAFLLDLLPEYMVPAHWVALDELPLTPSKKVDRKALPEVAASGFGAEYIAPADGTEAAIASIWADVLGVPGVSAHDDFFVLGGHSLLATRVLARLRDAFAVELPLRRLFEATTVSALATEVTAVIEAEIAALSDAEVEDLLFREGA